MRGPHAMPSRVLILTAVAALVVLSTIPSSQAQDGAGTGEAGWWTQRLGATAKEDGGIEVALGAAGAPQSVAAIDVVVPDQEGEVLLVLTEVGGLSTDRAAIELCRTTTDWEPANPGAYAARPTVECADVPPQLGRDATALEWVGSLSELLVDAGPGDTVGIALQPRGVPIAGGAPLTTPFQIDLAGGTLRVIEAAVPSPPATAPPSPDPGFVDPGVGQPGFVTPDLGSGGFDAGGFDAGGFDTGDFDTGPLPETAAPAAPPTTVATTEDDFIALGPVDGTSGPGRPWWRLALLTPISLTGGFGAAMARRHLRERLRPVSPAA